MINQTFAILKKITSKIGSGATPTGGQSSYKENGISLIRSQNVLDMSFSYDGLAFIDENQASKLDNVSVQEDDVLLNITGDSIARVCKVPKEVLPARVNQHVSIIRANKKIDSDFLLYYLIFRKDYLLRISRVGGTRNALTKEAIESIEVRLDKNDKEIAKVLSDLDAKIELNNRINAELEAMAKLVYEYWFVQFDFPISAEQAEKMGDPTLVGKPYKSSGGKMVLNEELKREIPEGWRSGTTAEIFEFNPTISIPKGSLAKYLDMNSIPQKGFMTLEPEVKEFNGGVKFQNGDVVVARITPCLENGKTGLITQLEGNEAGFGSTEFIVIRGKKMTLSGFASFLARSDSFRNFAIGNMTGTSGRKRVDAKTLKDYILPIPGSETLKEFEAYTSSIFQKQTINIKQNQQLSSLRDWLLPMLMNGQVKVAEVEERIEEELGMVAEPQETYQTNPNKG